MTLPTDLVDKHCPTCFIHYAAPKAMFDRKNTESECWYCPNGHQIIFKVSDLDKAKAEADRLRQERDQLKQSEAMYDEMLTAERKENRALQRHIRKVQKRVGNGVCPCCNRSFTDLQRHMAGKHPDYQEAA